MDSHYPIFLFSRGCMEQLTFFGPSLLEIEAKLCEMEGAVEKLRRSMFARLGELKQDYEFIYENFEIIKDLVELIKENENGKIQNKNAG